MKKSALFFLLLCSLINLNMLAQDQGITSPTHRENVGKVVFANHASALAFKKEQPSQFSNTFKASETIYARVYAAKALINTPINGEIEYNPILTYDLYVDGKQVGFKRGFGMYRHIAKDKRTYYIQEAGAGTPAVMNWTCWQHYLLPDLNDPELKYGSRNIAARAFALALLDATPGQHEIRLDVYATGTEGGRSAQIATGSFNLSLTAADQKALAFRYAPPLPKDEWAGSNKAGLIKELYGAFEQELRKKPILVGLSGRDWKEGTYRTTGQKYRKLAAWAIFPDGDGDGQVPITTFNWISDYSNGGWTKFRFDSHCNGCPDWDVDVAAVKALGNR